MISKILKSVFPSTDTPSALRCPGGSELVLVRTLSGHSDRVWSVAWHPNGDVLASCGGDKFVCLYDSTGVCFLKLESPHQRTVRRVSWSPDGHFLATCSFDATVVLWSVGEGARTATQCGVLEGHDHEVKACAWDSTGELLATCSRDKSVWVWAKGDDDIEGEHECMCVMSGHSQDVKYVVWHPAKEEIYSCSYDDSIRIWVQSEARDGDWFCDATLHGHTSTVWMVALDPVDPSRMVSCSDDESVMVWARVASTGWKRTATLSGNHQGVVYTIDWSKSNVVASGGADNAIILYEEKHADPATPGVSFAPTCFARGAHNGDVNCVQWNPLNPAILASCGDDGLVKIWEYK